MFPILSVCMRTSRCRPENVIAVELPNEGLEQVPGSPSLNLARCYKAERNELVHSRGEDRRSAVSGGLQNVERSSIRMSKSFKSDPALNSEMDERRAVFRSTCGENVTFVVQDDHLMRHAMAQASKFCFKLIVCSFSGRGRA